MKYYSQKQIADNIFEVKANGHNYKVYRIKSRFYRVEKDGEFFFNTSAFSIDKVSGMLSNIDFDDKKTK